MSSRCNLEGPNFEFATETTKSYFIIRRNYLKMEIDGKQKSQPILRLNLSIDKIKKFILDSNSFLFWSVRKFSFLLLQIHCNKKEKERTKKTNMTWSIKTILFTVLGLTIFSGLAVISERNPVHSVFFLVLTFVKVPLY